MSQITIVIPAAALATATTLVSIAAIPQGTAGLDWPQWGGPTRDFTLPAAAGPREWPADGPRVLWRRPLGEGYSSIALSGDTLVTMYRHGDDEIVAALDASTGETRWERRYAAPALEKMNFQQGPGPHATPLVHGGRVFAAGVTGRLHALDARTGAVLWSHRLIEDLGGSVVDRGYASSPLAYGEWIVVQHGGREHAVTALDARDGRIVWRGGSFTNVSSSPILIDVGGEAQIVALGSAEVVGLDARTGATRWRQPHPHRFGENIPTPVWTAGDLFVTSYADGGSRVLRLERDGESTRVREIWHHTRLRVYYTNVVRIGDRYYGSSGDLGPTLFTAVEARGGDVLWQSREIGRSSIVAVGDRLILRDDEGRLLLAGVGRDGPTVLGSATLVAPGPPTPPTVRGSRLYLRDRREILAVDLR
jgi:outer membrane protein assembly factor BamB